MTEVSTKVTDGTLDNWLFTSYCIATDRISSCCDAKLSTSYNISSSEQRGDIRQLLRVNLSISQLMSSTPEKKSHDTFLQVTAH